MGIKGRKLYLNKIKIKKRLLVKVFNLASVCGGNLDLRQELAVCRRHAGLHEEDQWSLCPVRRRLWEKAGSCMNIKIYCEKIHIL